MGEDLGEGGAFLVTGVILFDVHSSCPSEVGTIIVCKSGMRKMRSGTFTHSLTELLEPMAIQVTWLRLPS